MSFRRTPIKSLEDLEESTLTRLYASGKLDPSIAQPATWPPSPTFNDQVILVQADMTRLAIDAIVNAANKSLLGGGGIDGAIHSAAGQGLRNECYGLNGCETGDAKITKGYLLPAKHVIHTVGPIYWEHKDEGRDPASLLKSCYVKSLDIARRNGCKTVAFPCISTGIYGYPGDKAAIIATRTVRAYLEAQLEESLFGADEDKPIQETGEGEGEKIVVVGKKEEIDTKEVEEKEKDKDSEPAKASDEVPEGAKGETVTEDDKKETPEARNEETEDKATGGEEEEGQDAVEEEEQEPPFICKIEKVIFCVFLDKDLELYEDILPSFFPPADPNIEGSMDKLAREALEKPTTSGDKQPVKEEPEDTPGL
ncbi:hypothetical protein TWF718_009464 [Orbilia javanica]|uniref:Macro domain-containing protein n=1 Tax=Orbilia javanica TaxID=47235 RepID=A0AAN8RAH4_9PEZI